MSIRPEDLVGIQQMTSPKGTRFKMVFDKFEFLKYNTQKQMFAEECENLGIEGARLWKEPRRLFVVHVIFKSQEDLNLYLLSGSIKESNRVKLRVQNVR